MTRQEIIQNLIQRVNAKNYLEIGIGDGKVFERIQCDKKTSVDPCFSDGSQDLSPTFKLTSDAFFEQNRETFDVIFIDGLHEANQVERDMNNSLKALNTNGFIVCHDMNPTSENMQKVPRIQNEWTGDCWKAWVRIRTSNPHLSMCVVDTDYGCGIIQKGSQELLELLTYENLNNNRKEWLNLISVRDFIKLCT